MANTKIELPEFINCDCVFKYFEFARFKMIFEFERKKIICFCEDIDLPDGELNIEWYLN